MAGSQRKFKILSISLSIIIALLIGEIVLRLLLPEEKQFRIWAPGLDFTFEPDSTVIHGVHGKSQFTINSEGLRSTPPSTLLAIGGSTTIEMFLDNNETWTHLLHAANAGKNGLNSFHHIDQMKLLLQQFPETKTVIILMGINDLQLQLVRGEYTAGDSLERYNKTFQVLPDDFFPWYKRSGYWKLSRNLKHAFFSKATQEMVLDKDGKILIKHRKFRYDCKNKIDILPDWTRVLEGYKNNINTLIAIAKEKKVKLIFATQPVLWSAQNTKQQEALLWMGGKGNFQENGGEYYSSKVLNESMQLFNKTLMETGTARGIQVIDLYSLLPKNESIFYDDCHFTELGAKMVAGEIGKLLK
ncbi:MAG: GDSL-type esterase/lipase family protein [Flavobacteriales bacterium]